MINLSSMRFTNHSRQSILGHFLLLCLQCPTFLLLLSAQQSNPSGAKTQPPVKASSRLATGPTILLRSDTDCNVTFDDGARQALLDGETRKVRTTLGEHLITAVSADGRDHWKTVVQIEKPIQKVVLIELLKVRAQRENGEAEATRLQEEIAAKEEQAQKIRESRQQLAAKQETMRRRRAEISEKVGNLQIEAQDEDAQAAKEDAAGNELKQNAYNAASIGGNVNNMAAILSASRANDFYQSAQRRREHAKQLRQEIVHLQSQLQTLDEDSQ